MNARLVMFTLAGEKRAFAERLAGQFQNAMQSLEGFRGATFLADESMGEYGTLSLWASKEDADAAGKALAPDFQNALQGKLQGSPALRVFEVFVPTSG